MKRVKVATIVGTRPEIIRLARVIALLHETTDHVLIHTGQNYDYELNEIFFEELQLPKPDHYLNVDASSLGATRGGVAPPLPPPDDLPPSPLGVDGPAGGGDLGCTRFLGLTRFFSRSNNNKNMPRIA